MKWTDLALVFCTVFLSLALIVDFSFRAEKAVLYTTEEYNRALDRAAEDALTDAVLYEGEEGAVLDEERALRQFTEEFCFLFEAKTAEERSLLFSEIKAVVLTQKDGFTVYEYGGDASLNNPFLRSAVSDQLSQDALNRVFEQYLPGKLSISQIQEEDWYQQVGELQMYVIFEDDHAVFPKAAGLTSKETVYVRITRSAAVERKNREIY